MINTNPKSSSSFPTYDYANLQQEHKELKACSSFQPSHKLLSLLWEILLSQKCPDLNQILSLKPQDLGKLSIKNSVRVTIFSTLAAIRLGMRESLHALLNSSCWTTTLILRLFADTSKQSTPCFVSVTLISLQIYRTIRTCVTSSSSLKREKKILLNKEVPSHGRCLPPCSTKKGVVCQFTRNCCGRSVYHHSDHGFVLRQVCTENPISF